MPPDGAKNLCPGDVAQLPEFRKPNSIQSSVPSAQKLDIVEHARNSEDRIRKLRSSGPCLAT